MENNNKRRYWVYRIDTKNVDYFAKELNEQRLRQGWGYNEGQNLKNMTCDEGAKANLKMLKVKKHDYLLVPRLPDWNSISIVEATEDWNEGYKFEIDKEKKDYGHIFPAKLLCIFNRHGFENGINLGGIRSTLKNLGRFWNIDYLENEILKIVDSPNGKEELMKYQSEDKRLYGTIENCFKNAFNQEDFISSLSTELQKQFQAAEWENALVYGLQEIFPKSLFTVERTGGTSEVKHGTDVVIKFTSPLSSQTYVIAIQIKDYKDKILNVEDVVNQVNKAKYWEEQEDCILLEKVLVVTRTGKDENPKLVEACNNNKITLIMSEKLNDIINKIALKRIARKFPFMEI
jgi:hypothetical protein